MVSFFIGLILARILTPDDFGLYAVALSVNLFAMTVNDAGLIFACVQWPGEFRTIVPTASTIAVLSSLVVYGFTWFLAPSFSAFSGVPQACPLIRIMVLSVLVDGIAAIRTAKLIRQIEQTRLTTANFVGILVNFAFAVPMAILGMGAYSFAIGQLVGGLFTNAAIYRFADLPFCFAFDRDIASKLLRFSLPLVGAVTMQSVLLNADFIIVGKVLGATALGYYLLAFNISSWTPSLVGAAIRSVAVPSFSRLAEDGVATVALNVSLTVPKLFSFTAPIAVITAVLAPLIIEVVYGSKWIPAAAPLRFLMLLTGIRMLTSFAMDVLIAIGSSKATVWLNAGWAAVLIPALWFATKRYGIVGTAVAHASVAIVIALPLAIAILQSAGVSLAGIWPRLLRPAAGAFLSAAIAWLVLTQVNSNALLQLALSGAASVTTYTVVVSSRRFGFLFCRIRSSLRNPQPSGRNGH